MDYTNILNKQFNNVILSAKMVNNEFGETLEVVTTFIDLSKVEQISREISSFLETQSWFKDEYNLEVLSKGSDLNIQLVDLENYISQDIKIKTIKSIEGNNVFIVKLLENSEDQIKVQWNKKGQIRKINILKSNIQSIEKFIKF
ncbi:ribosome assembly cofactor RimP [Mycoplasma leonicaptivi]|uniref:ribosome assembly cofactor RimP n=1 Tax=Mycoplasma leonicaptivi TaxID=36742 RepID=UPI000480FC22|nr:ribosome assembly cofactor RimP [Mycoplasma leonicaptivi]